MSNFTIEYSIWVFINFILFLFLIEVIWSNVRIRGLKRKIRLKEFDIKLKDSIIEDQIINILELEKNKPFTDVPTGFQGKTWIFKAPMQVLRQRKLKVKAGKTGKVTKKKSKAKK